MAEYTVEQFRDAARRALDAGDTDAARKLIARGRALEANTTGGGASSGGGGGGSFGPRSAMEKVGGYTRALGSGIAQGVQGMASIPGMLSYGADVAAEKIGISPEGSAERLAGMNPTSPQNIQRLFSAATAGLTEYEPRSTGEEYTQTIGNFLPGAGAKVSNLVKFGLVPAVASETAGQATEGTQYEPLARTAAGIGSSLMMGRPSPNAYRGLPGEVDDHLATMSRAGMRAPTAGQITQSRSLMAAEGTLDPLSRQLDDFTKATMRAVGSKSDTATKEALRTAQRNIVNAMDEPLKGVNIVPTSGIAKSAEDIAKRFDLKTAGKEIGVNMRGMINRVSKAQKSGKPIDLLTLRSWRKQIRTALKSNNDASRNAAHEIRDMIDNMTDTALVNAGKTDAVAQIRDARVKYRNLIAAFDARSRAGAERGMLSPTAVNEAMKRQGRQRWATGQTTDLGDLAEASSAFLRPAPTVQSGGVRFPAMDLLTSGGGALAGYSAGGDWQSALAGAGAGYLGGTALQRLMRTGGMQRLLLEPGTAAAETSRLVPGLLAQ